MTEIPDKRHPNSPLVEVVFEVRFPGETAIECRRHEIQDELRTDYPNLWVPNVETGMALALEPFRFEREDRSAGVMLSLNRFGYYSRAYPGFDEFREECLRLMGLFGSFFSIQRLSRIGLRHINLIPFFREDSLVPFEEFFQMGSALSELFQGKFENISFAFVMPAGQSGTITTRIESIMRRDGSQEAFLLDFDYAKEGKFLFAEVDQHLNEAHDHSATLFHRLITPSYRDYIKQEEV